MGWSLSLYVFQKLTDVFVNKLRDPVSTTPAKKTSKAKKRKIRRQRRLAGFRLLPFLDDFALTAKSFAAAMELKDVAFALLDDLGLSIHPTKGYHTATQVGNHLGMPIDNKENEFRAPKAKLDNIATVAKQLLVRAAQNKRWVHVKALTSITRKTQFLYLTIPVATFYFRELHNVIKATESWTMTVRMTKQLK